jgi:predicted glycoside hydrolase/deacetylase ChbG (UPF0249 family)
MSGLVITADDLGMSPGVNRGVLEACRNGVVRSASLLVTFPDSAEGAELARAERRLEVGLHLDLVGGRPISDPGRIRSLVDADGRFHRLGRFTARLLTGRIRAAELALEIRAQADRAAGLGIAAAAWDSHRHVHLIPAVLRIVAPIARERGVRWLRRAAPPRAGAAVKAQLLGISTALGAPFARGIPGNDWYLDLSSLRQRPDAAAVALFAAYGGLGELGAHPGHPDAALEASGDALVLRRHDDLVVLTDPLLRAALGDDTVRHRVPAGGR